MNTAQADTHGLAQRTTQPGPDSSILERPGSVILPSWSHAQRAFPLKRSPQRLYTCRAAASSLTVDNGGLGWRRLGGSWVSSWAAARDEDGRGHDEDWERDGSCAAHSGCGGFCEEVT
jgi:hypothetical protein